MARLCITLGRVAAGFLVLVLALSVVVNLRYGWVAQQHALVAVSSNLIERTPAVPNPRIGS